MSISREPFGATAAGVAVDRITLTNRRGLSAAILTYGGVLAALHAPDRAERMANIVLGFDDLAGYLSDGASHGALVGRYANRIAGARFTLDGRRYELDANDGANQIHGGAHGFARVVWRAEAFEDGSEPGVRLTHASPDGEGGYPGALEAEAIYQWRGDRLELHFTVTTSAPTPVNLTHHPYFNLSGDRARAILDHVLAVRAEAYTPVDAALIPTGELRAVAGTPFDFQGPHAVGARIGADDDQLRLGRGYDHNLVLASGEGPAAVVYEPESGREIRLWTSQPGLQLYSGNHLGGRFVPRGGLCLEPQFFPDSPNKPAFPSCIARPGEPWRAFIGLELGLH